MPKYWSVTGTNIPTISRVIVKLSAMKGIDARMAVSMVSGSSSFAQ